MVRPLAPFVLASALAATGCSSDPAAPTGRVDVNDAGIDATSGHDASNGAGDAQADARAGERDGASETGTSGTTRVRFVDAVYTYSRQRYADQYPFEPSSLDVFVAGSATPIATGLTPFASAAVSPYVELPAGKVRFELRVSGQHEVLFTSRVLTLVPGGRATAVVSGDVNKPTSDFALFLLQEGFEKPATGKARVRLVDCGSIVGDPVDVFGGDDLVNPLATIPRRGGSPAAGLDVDAHGFTFRIKHGAFLSGVGAMRVPDGVLDDGGSAFVFFTGSADLRSPRFAGAYSALVVADGKPPVFVKQNPGLVLLPSIAGHPAIDVFRDGALVARAATASTALTSIELDPSATGHTLRLADAATGETLLDRVATGALAAGERYLALVTAAPGAASPTLSVVRESFPLYDPAAPVPSAGGTTLVSASPDAPPLTLGVFDAADAWVPSISDATFLSPTPAAPVTLAPSPRPCSGGTCFFFGLKTSAEDARRFRVATRAWSPFFTVVLGPWRGQDGAPGARLGFVYTMAQAGRWQLDLTTNVQ